MHIALNPRLGKDYSQLWKDLRGLKVNSHILFYRSSSHDTIEVVRVLHQRMDLKQRLENM